jgi:hypothetical protein
MSVFTTKVDGQKVTVVAANVMYVVDVGGKGAITFVSGQTLQTDVGYDSVRRNVAKATGYGVTESDSE